MCLSRKNHLDTSFMPFEFFLTLFISTEFISNGDTALWLVIRPEVLRDPLEDPIIVCLLGSLGGMVVAPLSL